MDGAAGWNAGGVPNSPGATAQLIIALSGNRTTTQDIVGGVTVGTIKFGNNNALTNRYWRILNTNGITLNQNGILGDGQVATISNSNTSSGASNALWISTGTLTLADDLLVINTGASTNVNGAIQLDTVIAGNGSITFNSTGSVTTSTNDSSPGAIWLNSQNTYFGNSLIQKGLVVVNDSYPDTHTSIPFTPFGASSNVVTIGQSGFGNAGVLSRDTNAVMNYDFVVAPGLPGELRVFGSASNASYTVSTGNISLGGDLSLRAGTSSLDAIQGYTGNLSGVGNLTKIGPAIALLSGTNTNSGTTTVSQGVLAFARPESLYNNQQGALAGFWDPSKIIVQPGASLGFNIGSGGDFSDSQIQTLNAMGSVSGGFMAGSSIALNPTVDYTYTPVITDSNGGTNSIGLTKIGPNKLTLTATNTYTGPTNVLSGTLELSGAPASSPNIASSVVNLQSATLLLSGGDNRLGTTATLAFNPANAANVTGTFDVGSTNQTLAALTFPVATTLNPPRAMTLNIAGSGSLTLNGPFDLLIGAGGTDSLDHASNHHQQLDMSGLNSFTFNNPGQKIEIGLQGSRATKQTNVATVEFATNNTITASALRIAHSGGGAGGGRTTIRLGQANNWNLGSFEVGLDRADADIQFASGLINPTITLRGTDGTSALPLVRIGTMNDNGTRVWDSLVDFSAGTTDALVNTMEIGIATPSGTTRDGTVNAKFVLGAGNMTVNDLIIGGFRPSVAGNGTDSTMAGNGTFTLNNAAGVLNATTIKLADVPVAAGGTGVESTSGTLEILNGLVKATTITLGAQAGGVNSTARIDFTNGTIQNTDSQNLAINGVEVRLMTDVDSRTFNATGSNSISTDAATVISGIGSLTKAGTGDMILGGANTFSGTTSVNGGILRLSNQLALQNSTLITNGIAFDSSVAANAFTLGGLSGSFSLTLANDTATGIVLSVGNNNTSTAYSGSLSGPGGFAKVGTGTLVLSGANSYAGTTTAAGGILQFAKKVALYNGVQANWTDTNFIVESGATAAFNVGGADEFLLAEFLDLATKGTATGGFKNGSNIGIDTTNGGDQTILTSITDTNGGANSLGLVKLGTGTLFLTANNTYTGPTKVLGGGLSVGSSSSISTGPLVIGDPLSPPPTTANIDFNADQTVASLTVATNSTTANTINIATGKTLNVAGAVSVGIPAGNNLTTNLTVTGGGTLAVNNPSADINFGYWDNNQSDAGSSVTVDLTAVGAFTADVNAFNLSNQQTAVGTTTRSTVLLSNTSNTITANSLTINDSSTRNAEDGLLVLGSGTNVINTDTLLVGEGKGVAAINFASQAPMSPGSITLGGKSTSKVNIVLGNNNAGTSGTSSGTLDFRGHTANVAAGTMQIGASNQTSAGGGLGVVRFDAGTFTVDSLTLAAKANSGVGSAQALIDVTGGTFTVNPGGSVTMGSRAASGGYSSGVIHVGGTGTLTSNAPFLNGSGSGIYSAVVLDGGTLDMMNNAIGSSSSQIWATQYSGGTLANFSEIQTQYLHVGNSDAAAVFTSSASNTVTVGRTGALGELYVGYGNTNGASIRLANGIPYDAPIITNGQYNLQSGATLTVNGWSNIGRDGGTGVFNNSGTFITTEDLRIGANYESMPGGNGTLNNLTGGTVQANWIVVGDVAYSGSNSTGLLTVASGSSVSTTGGAMFVGIGGNGTVDQQGGSVASALWITLGERPGSTGTYNMASGTVSTGENLVLGYQGVGDFNQVDGAVTVAGALVLGWNGGASGDYQMDAGTIAVTGPVQLGLVGGATGTFIMNGGTLTCNDWVVTGTFGGQGHFFQHGGTVNTLNFDVAQSAGSMGDYHMDSTVGPSVIDASGFFGVGDNGIGTFDLENGEVRVGSVSVTNSNRSLFIGWESGSSGTLTQSGGSITTRGGSDVRVGENSGSTGVLTQTAGSIVSADWTYIGRAGSGTYNLSGTGSYSTDDNFSIGLDAGSIGNMTMADNSSLVVVGGQPSPLAVAPSTAGYGTGNFIVGRHGTATFTMTGGTLDLRAASNATGTLNSASFSLAANNQGLGYELDHAKDANLIIGERTGIGTMTQSGGTVNVGGNVFVGGADFATLTGGTGTLTLSGSAQMRVGYSTGGVSSPTGGDVVLGGLPTSTGRIYLKGGLLDVAHGSGMIGAAMGTTEFQFTGGTLKVNQYNVPNFGGNLGALVQTNTDAASILDVSGNDTVLHGGYTLTSGTVLVGQQLTVNGNADLSGNFTWQLGDLTTSGAGDDFGLMTVSTGGILTIGGSSSLTLDFSLLGTDGPNSANSFWSSDRSWKIVDTIDNNAPNSFASLTNAIFTRGEFSTTLVGGDIFLNFTSTSTTLPGDFDGDGDVDGADFVAWQTNFPGTYDGGDFADWQDNFPTPSGPGNSPVPEPATWLLTIASVAGLFCLKGKARRRQS